MLYFTLNLYKLSIGLIILIFFIGNVIAASEDATKPIDIAADSVEIDEGQSSSTYSGQVEVSQGSMKLWANYIAVQHQPSRQPSKITATGSPVRYSQRENNGQEVKARAERMEYDILKEEIVLIGNASFNRNQDSFSSDRIFYDRNRGIIKAGASAQGHQRVHISIMPTASSKKSSSKNKTKLQDEAPVESKELTEVETSIVEPTKTKASKSSTKSNRR